MKRLLAALLLQLSGTLQLSSSEAPAGRRLHGSSESACGDGAHVEGVLRCTHGQNCSALLQAAIDAAAAENGAGTLCIGGTWPVQPIALRSNLRLHLTSDATIIAQRGAFHGGADHLIDVLGVQNVSIVGSVGGGSRLVMRKSDYVDTTLYSHSEGRHALYIMESRHVRVSDLEIMEPGGDSVYLGGSIGGGPATDVELLRVVSRNAYRNGLSITGARDVVVRSCSFLNTSGTPPEAGIDIEPNEPSNWIHNISFFDLQSRWNRGSGLSLALGKLSCEAIKRPCHHPAECVCPKDPPSVTVTVDGAQIQGVSEMGLNASALVQGLDFNIGILIAASPFANTSHGGFNFSNVSVNETVQPGLEFENKPALGLPVRFTDCSWSHVATAKTVRWGGQNVPLLLHQSQYGAIGGITFEQCAVNDGAMHRPWLKCDSCGSRGHALEIEGHVTVTNSAGCTTGNIPTGKLTTTCDRDEHAEDLRHELELTPRISLGTNDQRLQNVAVVAGSCSNASSWGAVGDGVHNDTAALQAAIDACSSRQEQLVLVSGTFRITPLTLRSNLHLTIADGVILRADDNISTWPQKHGSKSNEWRSIIQGDGIQNCTIDGGGLIDGQGKPWWDMALAGLKNKTGALDGARPRMVVCEDCRDFTLRGVTLLNSPCFHYFASGANCVVTDITIQSPSGAHDSPLGWVAPNTDGIDIACNGGYVARNRVVNGDDSLCVKSPGSNILFEDNYIEQGNGIVIGTSDNVDIHNITYRNTTANRTAYGAHIKYACCSNPSVKDCHLRHRSRVCVPLLSVILLAGRFKFDQVGSVSRVVFENITVIDPYRYVIGIDQDDQTVSEPTHPQPLKSIVEGPLANVSISDVTFRNIRTDGQVKQAGVFVCDFRRHGAEDGPKGPPCIYSDEQSADTHSHHHYTIY